jgi:ribosomal protein L18
MRPIHKPKTRGQRRYRRHLRLRKKVQGTENRPRLAVYRSFSTGGGIRITDG